MKRFAGWWLAWACTAVLALAVLGWPHARRLVTGAAWGDGAQALDWAWADQAAQTQLLPPSQLPGTAGLASLEAEGLLRQAHEALSQGERTQALSLAAALVQRFPNFQLGHLLHADLLSAGLAQPVPVGGDEAAEPASPWRRRLGELQQEWQLRIAHSPTGPWQQGVPQGVLYLDPVWHRHLLVVDVRRARMYVLANRTPDTVSLPPPQLQMRMNAYVSVGVQGAGKRVEGDGRTPLGVYFVQRQLHAAALPDLYGVGALPLNYPNAVDAMLQRTGSGIWLHGSPSAQYARAPQASDGCVVLSNTDMAPLLRLESVHMTPVLIAPEVTWHAGPVDVAGRDDAMSRLNGWSLARRGDELALRGFYSAQFQRERQGLDIWWPKLRQVHAPKAGAQPWRLLSALQWHDQGDWMVATWLDPDRNVSGRPVLWRNYWLHEAGVWRVVFDGPV